MAKMLHVPSVVGRHAQLEELATVAGLHAHANEDGGRIYEPAPPLVVVYGGVSTGKTVCVAHALRRHASTFAMLDCTGVLSTRVFCRDILGQLQANHRARQREKNLGFHDGKPMQEIELAEDDGITITDAPKPVVRVKPKRSVRNRKKPQKKKKTQQTRGRRRVEDSEDGDEESEYEDEEDDEEEEEDEELSDGLDEDDELDGVAPMMTDKPVGLESQKYTSLNFLAFVKALRLFMNSVIKDDADTTSSRHRRTMYIALDNVEKLMDRNLSRLLTCLLAVNDQLDYMHILDPDGAPWSLSVLLIARAVSLRFELFLETSHPSFIHFPPYKKEEVAEIVAFQIERASTGESIDPNNATLLRKWLVYMYDLLPHAHNDWLEFRHLVVQMLPSFHDFFDIVSANDAELPQLVRAKSPANSSTTKSMSWKQLQNMSRESVSVLEKSRRRHLFGYDMVGSVDGDPTITSGDPMAFITFSKLNRSCLLLIIASYLSSFTPHEADSKFLSSSSGVKRKKRVMKAASGPAKTTGKKARSDIPQQMIGPKMFTLTRMLAIYSTLQVENDAANGLTAADTPVLSRSRADIFKHLAILIRLRLLQRMSPPNALDQLQFRCVADIRLVEEVARHIGFPLDAYLNTHGG
ncbi:hypothetical protein Poli38472_009846 [Pythium oligandrum]|uniref:Origin recognition complex subunit 5 C-terminal domain-containing protein n=1 Tax=Pythium oligandrum TaxID=41045 RepID=A0A8K1FL59_PYTOL|nr:hypothetical protein Poli38472_009846 [Pythium oligandrum]|eukprot:TMW62353.1 hypothetical protein Poli38472_009846 [Pythium oligandrum]